MSVNSVSFTATTSQIFLSTLIILLCDLLYLSNHDTRIYYGREFHARISFFNNLPIS